MKNFKVYCSDYGYEDPFVVEANDSEDAAEKFLKYLFENDPKDYDTTCEIDGITHQIWTEVEPVFVARKL